jgi:hypothetical protein
MNASVKNAPNGELLKRIAWGLLALSAAPMAWALWLGLHLKQAPQNRGPMMQWLLAGVGLYMVGRFLLIRRRWVEKRASKGG